MNALAYKVGYIGNYYRIPEFIYQNDNFELTVIVCEQDKLDNELVTFSMVREVALETINSKIQLVQCLNRMDADFWIMCSFGRKVPLRDIEDQEVYNIHYAALPDYKGRHPTFWATVLDEKKIGITIHQITECIDEGDIISQRAVDYYLWMNEDDLFEKLTEKVPELLNDLFLYKKGEKNSEKNRPGNYYKPVEENDYTISLSEDSCALIYNKVRAQSKYRGAKLVYEGNTYWVKTIQFGMKENQKADLENLTIPYDDKIVMIISEYEKE